MLEFTPSCVNSSEKGSLMELPDTRESLILRIRDSGDRDAWDRFVSIYCPVVYRLARARGLQDADAQDLSQTVLVAIAKSVSTWSPEPGKRFRQWLMRIAKNTTINILSRRPKDLAMGGTDAEVILAQLVDCRSEEMEQLEHACELEYRRQLYRMAAQTVRLRADEDSWLAFSLTTIDGLTVDEAACKLGKSTGAIYVSRGRIMRRLRDAVRKMESESEE